MSSIVSNECVLCEAAYRVRRPSLGFVAHIYGAVIYIIPRSRAIRQRRFVDIIDHLRKSATSKLKNESPKKEDRWREHELHRPFSPPVLAIPPSRAHGPTLAINSSTFATSRNCRHPWPLFAPIVYSPVSSRVPRSDAPDKRFQIDAFSRFISGGLQ